MPVTPLAQQILIVIPKNVSTHQQYICHVMPLQNSFKYNLNKSQKGGFSNQALEKKLARNHGQEKQSNLRKILKILLRCV